MKKVLFSLLTLAVLFFSSCRGDEGPMGPQGPAGPAGQNGQNGHDGHDGAGLQYLRFDFTVDSKDWILAGEGKEKYYKYHFDFSELTANLCDIAIVNAYYMWDDENGVTYQSLLPTVRHHVDGETYYTTTIDYDYAPGNLNFYVTNSDFFVDDKPETMVFRVVVYFPN